MIKRERRIKKKKKRLFRCGNTHFILLEKKMRLLSLFLAIEVDCYLTRRNLKIDMFILWIHLGMYANIQRINDACVFHRLFALFLQNNLHHSFSVMFVLYYFSIPFLSFAKQKRSEKKAPCFGHQSPSNNIIRWIERKPHWWDGDKIYFFTT